MLKTVTKFSSPQGRSDYSGEIRHFPLLITLLVTATLTTNVFGEVAEPVVSTTYGPVRGAQIDGVAVFKGIPYAAAPTGKYRWMPTREPAAWSTPLDAQDFGPVCQQPVLENGDFAREDMSEDCLSVNIVSPDLSPEAPQPVMVWVHGGAYFVGSGREALATIPSGLTRRDVVLVSFNYRLGRLGFLAHPVLSQEQTQGPGGNYWLDDQIAALRWVRDNISAFGGDPQNVTIFGVSAGASSVNALVASPTARGLFKRAIAQSGGGLFNAERSLDVAHREGIAYLESWNLQGRKGLATLRGLSGPDIVDHESGPPAYGAIHGTSLLPSPLSVAFASGNMGEVDYMAGSNSDEASIFGLMGFTPEVLKSRFGIELAKVRHAYDPSGQMDENELIRQVQTDFIFTSGANGMAALAARNNRNSFVYRFAYVKDSLKGQLAGVPHGGEVPFVLDSLEDATASDKTIAGIVQDYWTSFAKTGHPKSPLAPDWPRYTPSKPTTLIISDRIRSQTDFRAPQLDIWFDKWSAKTGLPAP